MRFLVLRFGNMGDVALLAPVLHALARKYSAISITLVTRKAFEPFFFNIPGVEVIGVDFDYEYRGLYGLYRLYRQLRKLGPYTHGADLQSTYRSRILRFLFRLLTSLRFARIVKGQREKRLHIRRRDKVLEPLPHVVERYMHVFERAGISAEPDQGPWINPDTGSRALAKEFLLGNEIKTKKRQPWIGIAPFASYQQKTWPIVHTHELLSLIQRNLNARVFLFGGGEDEIKKLRGLHAQFDNTVLVAGNLSLDGEIALLLRMDVMIAMDAFNMHLAALLGKRVLSIWGATHPYSGFGPYGADPDTIIQIAPDDLSCRPCSITGSRPCFRGDLACLNWITARNVFEKLKYELLAPEDLDTLPQTD
jgi:ADP-heptose:LPS heptosyltransferase